MIYALVALIVIVLIIHELTLDKNKTLDKKIGLFLIFIVLVMIAGLRNEVGDDWYSYINFYNDHEQSKRVEIGYRLINNIFSNIGTPYSIFLILINSLSIYFILKFIYLNSKFIQIAILIYFYEIYFYYNLSGIRQAIAISLICFGFRYALKKELLKYAIIVILAATFHKSALVSFLIFFIPRNKINLYYLFLSYKLYLLIIVIALMYYMYPDLLSLASKGSFFQNILYYTAQNYKSDMIYQAYFIGIMKRLIPVFIYIFYKKYLPRNSLVNYFFNIYIFGLLIFIMTYMISPDIGTRLSVYFTIFEILLIGNLVYFVPDYRKKIVILSIYLFIVTYKLNDYIHRDSYLYNLILF
jgi:hypothetical protein